MSALAGIALPHVHAAENNTIQVALVGCGGRGTGAAINALSVKNGPTKLVAMADEALYTAKAAGRNRINGWRPAFSSPATRRSA